MIRVFTMKAAGKDFLAASWSPYLTEERKKLADRKKGERERQLFLGAEVLLNLSLQRAGIDIPPSFSRMLSSPRSRYKMSFAISLYM